MGKNVFESSGIHADKLMEIYNKMIESKIRNGEQISQDESWNIESEVFGAYQTILENAKDGNTIAKSIEYLKKSIENAGVVTDINSFAISAVEKSILENNRNNINNIEAQEKIASAILTTEIIENNIKNLDNVFNKEMLENLETEIQKIKTGDENAYNGMVTFEHGAKLLGQGNELNQKTALGIMMRLAAANDSRVNTSLLVEFAEKYGFDILEKDSSGKLVVNEEKLTTLYQSKMPEGSKAASLTIEDFKKINERVGKKARTEGRLLGDDLTANGISQTIKTDATKANIRKQVFGILYKDGESELSKISELYENYPDMVKEILKQRIEVCNKMQESGRSNSVISRVQNEIALLGEAIQMSERTSNKTQVSEKVIDNDDEMSIE